ncbi:MAG TPA: hypothetical protein VLJ58_06855 [Ramlibacter sp.]|nr:hypothetical protein [Ramlibacter sp.]
MTAPRIPNDEAPFSEEALEAFLRSMSTDMVLVGGQALAFWMKRYGIDAQGAMISNDGDALGDVRAALKLSRQLRAKLVLPDPAALTSLVAQLRIPVADGKVRNIDVLHLIYTISGLSKSNEFTRRVQVNAVTVQIEPGFEIRVMHPLDVLESRAHNAVGLIQDKGEHVVTQAKWAIEVARQVILRTAAGADVDSKRVGGFVQRLYRLWSSSVGKRLFKERGLCLLDAIDVKRLRKIRPDMEPQWRRVADAKPGIRRPN